jgi:translation initiation factor 2 subunit 3
MVPEDPWSRVQTECRLFILLLGTIAQDAPIIPISATHKYNLDVVCEYLCTKIPPPVRDLTKAPHFVVLRSFDMNKPGTEIESLSGGLVASILVAGTLKVRLCSENTQPSHVRKDRR